MHVTTRIPGKKHDDLLKEKGFGSFPTLCFMDADGKVLLSRVERTIEGFESAKAMLDSYAALKARADAGDEQAVDELLYTRIKLGNITYDEACEHATKLGLDMTQASFVSGDAQLSAEKRKALEDFRLKAIGRMDLEKARKTVSALRPGLDDAAAKRYDAILVDIQLGQRIQQASKDAQAKGERMSADIWYELFKEGMLPSERSGYAFSYWNGVATSAEKAGDLEGFEKAVGELRQLFGDGPNKAFVERLEKRLAELRGSKG